MMETTQIVKQAQQMETMEDLLALLNLIKQDEAEKGGTANKFHPFTIRQLNYYCNPNHTTPRYKQFSIKKKSGGERLITAPHNRSFKMLLHCVNTLFQAMYTPPCANAMGFTKGRSVVTNARVHVGQNYVFNSDIRHILKFVEFRTKDEKEKRYRFEPKEQKDVYSIDMVHKINAFATQFAKGDKVSLGMLRTVRNGYIHENPKEPTNHYIQFVTSNSMESIRALLKRFVSSVKTHLLAPPLQTGTIKSALPGAYVIVWDGKEQSEVIDKSCLPNANKNDRIMKVWGVCIPT